MIDLERYEMMKERYGQYGSWAVWHPAGNSPKSFTDNMEWVNDPNLLNILNTGYVFVGLNWSSTHGDVTHGGTIPWANFHSGYSRQNDYKLRFALAETKYWGSYITDVIKLFAEVDSKKVKSYLNANPDVVRHRMHPDIVDCVRPQYEGIKTDSTIIVNRNKLAASEPFKGHAVTLLDCKGFINYCETSPISKSC